jgi:hypothetical protein
LRQSPIAVQFTEDTEQGHLRIEQVRKRGLPDLFYFLKLKDKRRVVKV